MKNQLTAGLRRATTTFQSFSAGQKAVTIVVDLDLFDDDLETGHGIR